MAGIISFCFDDGNLSHYEQAFKVFGNAGVSACIALVARWIKNEEDWHMSISQALEMQESGWEVIGHSMNHIAMKDALSEDVAITEIVESKQALEALGFKVRLFQTPMSVCHSDMFSLLKEHYDGAYTVYTNSNQLPIEELVIRRPVSEYQMNRACMNNHSLEKLKSYVDYVAKHDEWLVFYDHDLGVNGNITADMLVNLLEYCKQSGVEILTCSEALDRCASMIV